MDHKILLKILDVYEISATDEEYVRLYADYAPAQKKCKDCRRNYHKTSEKV